MGSFHICTTDSLRAGCEDIPPLKCWLCGNQTMLVSWCDATCDTCGANSEDAGSSINAARHRVGMTRKQFADEIGVKPSTVSSYDYAPSRVYVEKCRAFFRSKIAPLSHIENDQSEKREQD